MLELNGKYSSAKIFTNNCDDAAVTQILEFLNQEFTAGQKVRIMPDVHAGAGCTIGTTMTITDKICPNLVGVDISCGMLVVELGQMEFNRKYLTLIDNNIRKNVPSGFAIRGQMHDFAKGIDLQKLCCKDAVSSDRAYLSIGTLGGGNHFIELNEDNEGNKYLVIHSGSRHLGVEVAKHYQKAAYEELCKHCKSDKQAVINALIVSLKEQGRQSEIQTEIAKLSNDFIPEELAYCEGQLFEDYIHDMKIMQKYADLNRRAIAASIIGSIETLETFKSFTTVHNYIDTNNMILRKGAVSAQKGEQLIIPMNMRDGSLLCVGKGNRDWNYSAPHGAGRLMSRAKAKNSVLLEDFEHSMAGIYTTSVNASTIDEAPMVYKPMAEIIENIKDTVEIQRIIKPIYNFKAS